MPREGASQVQIKRLIEQYESQSQASRSRGITKYVLDGQPLWLIPSPCCDQFNYLYNAAGQPVCAPSGGFAGRGNGKCPVGIKPYLPAASASASAPRQ